MILFIFYTFQNLRCGIIGHALRCQNFLWKISQSAHSEPLQHRFMIKSHELISELFAIWNDGNKI